MQWDKRKTALGFGVTLVTQALKPLFPHVSDHWMLIVQCAGGVIGGLLIIVGIWPEIRIIFRFIADELPSLLLLNPLRYRFWWKHRPRLSMNIPVIKQQGNDQFVTDSRADLIIHEGHSMSEDIVSVSYENAVFVIEQATKGIRKRLVYRPVECGGIIAQKHKPTIGYRSVQIEFSAINIPLPNERGLDVTSEYSWSLSGVEVTFWRNPRVTGKVAPIHGEAFGLAPQVLEFRNVTRQIPEP
jgi:hypothetical protein